MIIHLLTHEALQRRRKELREDFMQRLPHEPTLTDEQCDAIIEYYWAAYIRQCDEEELCAKLAHKFKEAIKNHAISH